jgi:hypothetical protein
MRSDHSRLRVPAADELGLLRFCPVQGGWHTGVRFEGRWLAHISHGVRSVLAICQEASCGHTGSINVDSRPEDFPVPDLVAPPALGVRLAQREDATGSEVNYLLTIPKLTLR